MQIAGRSMAGRRKHPPVGLRRVGGSVLAAAVFLLVASAAAQTGSTVGRPEIRSYQPYSGLQSGFAPPPPVLRGVKEKRPRVILPRPVVPLAAPQERALRGGYAYCRDGGARAIEPRQGPYAPRPQPPRSCF